MTYNADESPIKTKFSHQPSQASEGTYRRGYSADPFLCQQMWYRYFDALGNAHTCAVFEDNSPLTHGKTAVCIFAAGSTFILTPRMIGHMAFAINHLCFVDCY